MRCGLSLRYNRSRHKRANNPDPVGETLTPPSNEDTSDQIFDLNLAGILSENRARSGECSSSNLVMATSAYSTRRLWRPVTTHSYLGESDSRSFALPNNLIRVGSLNSRGFPKTCWWLQLTNYRHLDSNTKVGDYLARSWYRPPNQWDFLNDVAFGRGGR